MRILFLTDEIVPNCEGGAGFSTFLLARGLKNAGHNILIIIGTFTPYKFFGFMGGGLAVFGLLLIIIGLLADILDKIRQTQEKILYYEKKRNN